MFSDPSSGKMFCNSDIRYDKDQWLNYSPTKKQNENNFESEKSQVVRVFLMTLHVYGKVEEVPYYAHIVEMLLSSSTNQMW